MLVLIFLVLALLLVQAALPGHYLLKQVGPERQMGPRDDLPPPTPPLSRSRNALRNLQETLPIFLSLALLNVALGTTNWLALAGAATYLVARVIYLGCYMMGLSPWRSVSWTAALIGMALMAVPLLPRLLG